MTAAATCPQTIPNNFSTTILTNSSDVTDDGGGSTSRRPNNNIELLKTSYDERLKTFANRWRVNFVSKEALAAAMFYFTGYSDIVCCPYCKVEVGKWEDGDDPLADHIKWSPNCSFVRDQFNLQPDTMRANTSNYNAETAGGIATGQAVASAGHDTCGKFGIIHSHTSIPENSSITRASSSRSFPAGVQQVKQPSYRQYHALEKRLETFVDWPVSLAQKPKDLAEAGFFYTGKSDQTVCFHCGGGLKDWESNDQPWQQHAKWFPNCPFVLLQKGLHYVMKQQGTAAAATAEPIDPKQQPSAAATTTTTTAATAEPADQQPPVAVTASPPKVVSTGDEARNSTPDSIRCKICLDKEMGVVFLPCGHMVACVDCAPVLTSCAVCRAKVEAHVRVFLS